MNKELIERMAKKVGGQLESWMTNPPKPAMWHFTPEQLASLIASVAEECAKTNADLIPASGWGDGYREGQTDIMNAIRSKFSPSASGESVDHG
ncbi:MAG: hypothetical protein V4451_16115 [Pseudomonadota bacterium]